MLESEARSIALEYAADRYSCECEFERASFSEARTFDDGMYLPASWGVHVSIPPTITQEHGHAPVTHPKSTVIVSVDPKTREAWVIPAM